MIDGLAFLAVLVVGLYLVGLAVVSFIDPARATRFLTGFARSAGAHYLELAFRLVAGAAIVLTAPGMLFSGVFAFASLVLGAVVLASLVFAGRMQQ